MVGAYITSHCESKVRMLFYMQEADVYSAWQGVHMIDTGFVNPSVTTRVKISQNPNSPESSDFLFSNGRI